MKKCSSCGTNKSLKNFGPSGKAKRCKDCARDYARVRAERIRCELADELIEKSCWRCKRILPIEQFAWKDLRCKGRDTQCSSCRDPNGVKRCVRCGKMKPKAEFCPKGAYLNSYCKPCDKQYAAGQHRLRLYGVSSDEYKFAVEVQESCCAICGKWTEVLWIDHDHSCCPGTKSCGKCRRGLLCKSCNGGLGMFFDDVKIMRRAITYLETFRRGEEFPISGKSNLLLGKV